MSSEQRPHPIVERLLPKLLDFEHRSFAAREDDLRALTAELLSLGSGGEVAAAVMSVLELASFIDAELKAPRVADALVAAVQPTLPLLERSGASEADASALRRSVERLGRAADAMTPIAARAPGDGETRAGPLARSSLQSTKRR